jgi:hypothetical protein
MIQNKPLFLIIQFILKTQSLMRTNHQSVGGFLKSSTFSVIIYCNFLFTFFFLLSLGFQIGKTKQQSVIASGIQVKPVQTGMVTLAKLP